MINLYIKTVSASLVVLIISILTFKALLDFSSKRNSEVISRFLNEGNFSLIESLLKQQKSSQWNKLINDSDLKMSKRVRIIEFKNLKLSDKEKKHLLAGQIVYSSRKKEIFLSYSLNNVYAFKLIDGTEKIIRLTVGITLKQLVNSAAKLSFKLIKHRLSMVETNKRPKLLKEISKEYQLPLKIVNINKIKAVDLENTNNENVFYQPSKKGSPIQIIYLKLDKYNALSFGPIYYPSFSLLHFNLEVYFLIGVILITVITVIFMTWLFSRNIKRLIKVAQNYSNGDFKSHIYINPLSTLNKLNKNITKMGKKIERLMDTQKNMAKFVAHEIRTPLYTIQLAMDTLSSELKENKSDEVNSCVNDIDDDIENINALVESFLLYSQCTSNVFYLNISTINIVSWLDFYINKTYRKFNCISFYNKTKKSDIKLNIDEKQFTYALNNLVSNALKFKKNKIHIILEELKGKALIHVDDDGPGLSIEEAENIFNAFSSLSKHTHKDYKHLGLGLNISMSIIKKHPDGNITIHESPILGGARFTIELPRSLCCEGTESKL